MADEPDRTGEVTGLTRRELLRRAGVGAAAVGVAGSGASKAFGFSGPHKFTGRWLKGNLAKLSTYNPKTKKYFALSDNYVPDPVIWRHDLWYGLGEAPTTWAHVLKAAPKLKAIGHPIGIGMSNELDSNMANIALMMCFGSFIQNADNQLTINSKHTVDALKFMAS